MPFHKIYILMPSCKRLSITHRTSA